MPDADPAIRDLRDYVSLTQASRQIKRSVTTTRTLADSGKLLSIRDPLGRRLILRSDVERFLRQEAMAVKHSYDRGESVPTARHSTKR